MNLLSTATADETQPLKAFMFPEMYLGTTQEHCHILKYYMLIHGKTGTVCSR